MILTAAYLELGKNTLWGWITAALIFILFFVSVSRVPEGKNGLYWICLGACAAGVILTASLSGPPVRAIPAVSAKDPERTEIVTVEEGRLTGVVNGNGSVEVFAGIPYAKPPVGELRWKAPEAPDPWEGVRVCDTFAPMSMQDRGNTVFNTLTDIAVFHTFRVTLEDNFLEPMSEDSLYLNVWRPKGTKDGDALPVLVYIHGGSLTGGRSTHEQYNGERMAEQGIVVVSIAYRLNVFGYFAHEELAEESPDGATGNYGLLDQIRALEWIKKNISSFGGDPERITLHGESAGASSVNALCASPLTEGLFLYAIADSSGITAKVPYHTFRPLEAVLEAGRETVSEFGKDSVRDLRTVPAEKLVKTRQTFSSMTVDGYALREMPWETYEKGNNHEKALLSGFNAHEADLFALMNKVTAENYEQALRTVLGSWAGDAAVLFPPEKQDPRYRVVIDAGGDAKGSFDRVLSAAWFTYSHYDWSRLVSAQGRPVYEYYFTKDNRGLGSNHAGELRYVYGNLDRYPGNYDAEDREISHMMMQAWVSFVKTGDPNCDALPERWKAFAEDPDTVYEFGLHTGHVRDPYRELYDLIDLEQEARLQKERLKKTEGE